MWIIVTIIILFVILWRVILPIIGFYAWSNSRTSKILNDDIKKLIHNEEVLKIATLITQAEIKGDFQAANILLQACLSKTRSFAKRVDRIRNELRIKNGLDPLDDFCS